MGRRCYYCGKELAGVLARYDHYHVEKCPNPPKSFGDWIFKNIKGSLTDFALWCLVVREQVKLQRFYVDHYLAVNLGMWSIVIIIIGATLELTAVTFLVLFIPSVILLAMASAYVVYATDWKPKATEEDSQIRGKAK